MRLPRLISDVSGVWTRGSVAFGWLIHSNLIIATAATGVAVTTIGVFDLPRDPFPLLFVFVATLFAYTINRFTDRAADAVNVPQRAAFIQSYGHLMFAGAGALYLLTVGATWQWYPRMLWVTIFPPVVALAYATGAFERLFVFKNGLVGMIWACIPLGLGLHYDLSFGSGIVLFAAIVGLLLATAAGLFDIKDIAGDRRHGVDTLPVRYGPDVTRWVALTACVSVVPLVLVGAITYTPRFIVLLGYPAYLIAVVPFARTDRGALFYGLVIDGEHIVIGAIAGLLWVV